MNDDYQTLKQYQRISSRVQVLIFKHPRVLLLLLTFFVFGSGLFYGSVSYDDPVYLNSNPLLGRGDLRARVVEAFSSFNGMWHPLTLSSMALDGMLFHNRHWAYKLTNLWLHCANGIILLSCLRHSKIPYRISLACSALFLFHPFAVESVAWISERKGLLCAFFLLLAYLFYCKYSLRRSSGSYLASFVAFSLSLLAKPSSLMFPVCLTVMVVARLRFLRHLRQKPYRLLSTRYEIGCLVPFFVVSALVLVITLGAEPVENDILITQRVATSIISYATLIIQTPIFPNASVVALRPTSWPEMYFLGATAVVVFVSYIVYRHGGVLAASFFTGAVLLYFPMCGIVAYGPHWWGDRNGYLSRPLIFLAFLMLGQLALERANWLRPHLGGILLVYLLTLAGFARATTYYWQNSEAFWTHCLKADTNHRLALVNLGSSLAEKGDSRTAIAYWKRSLFSRWEPVALHNLSRQFYIDKAFKRSTAFASAALQEDPSDRTSLVLLADAVLASPALITNRALLNRFDAAARKTEAYPPDNQSSTVLLRRLQIAAMSGDLARLRSILEDPKLQALVETDEAARATTSEALKIAVSRQWQP